MRIAFTIILNGLHHLQHNDYYKFLLTNFDYWVVVEGAVKNTGSTSWCNEIASEFHNNGKSVDGTNEFLQQLKTKYSNLIHIEPNGLWDNKDHQVNQAITAIQSLTKQCYLWEIDADEQWTLPEIQDAERQLTLNNAKTGCFLCDYYVGPNLIVKGAWGEGYALPYRRLWDWHGELFESHEPPRLVGGNGLGVLLTNRFNHYALYYEKDVLFKAKWYHGYEKLHERWLKIQTETKFPKHISELLGKDLHWGQTNSVIIKNEIIN